jgi:hypothetical protein
MKPNVTLITAVACSTAWLILLATLPEVPGAVNLLYALAMVLYARRAMVGAPSFRS